MTYDESNAELTDKLTGRTIAFIARQGKELIIQTTDGHSVVLQADQHGNIMYKRTDCSVVIPGVSLNPRPGQF